MARIVTGWVEVLAGANAAGMAAIREGLTTVEESGQRLHNSYALALLARSHLRADDPTAARLADLYSLTAAIVVVAGITAASGMDVALRMTETRPPSGRTPGRAPHEGRRADRGPRRPEPGPHDGSSRYARGADHEGEG